MADLFTWREEAEAAQRVAEAQAARVRACEARRLAPHGEVRIRQQRLEEATLAALQAERELAAVQREKVGR
jgi:hypothetical protein